jgi:hypothetical protein
MKDDVTRVVGNRRAWNEIVGKVEEHLKCSTKKEFMH